MQRYNVTGMSCAACSQRVEKAVLKVEGVKSCSVSLLTNSMGVEGTAEPEKIISAVKAAGYGASVSGEASQASDSSDDKLLEDTQTPVLKKRLIASLGFLAVLLYFSMGHMMFNLPLPSWFNNNHVAIGLVQLILSAIIMVINQRFFISGFKSLWHRAPNMDTLVALGSMASFVWSVYALFAMTDAQLKADGERVALYMNEFYFESAAMILTLITVGKMLEARSKGKTTDALKSLMRLSPKEAAVIIDGKETNVPVGSVKKGDIFVVRAGESIPVDGIVKDGSGAVDESCLTGESIPCDKSVGDQVFAATINQSGYLRCEASRVGSDTTLSQIIKMVSDAAATKAPIAKIADKVSGVFVPAVISIAVLTTLIWLFAVGDFGYALARGISVLVISCPCALGLATPVAIMVGSGVGAKNGILFKTAVSLEETGKIKVIALDKTGTITKGEPSVTDVIPAGGFSESELLRYALAVEAKSEHPLAGAVIKEGTKRGISYPEAEDFKTLSGSGVSGLIESDKITGGSLGFVKTFIDIPHDVLDLADSLSESGKTPLLFARNSELLGIIAVADTLKPDSKQAICELKDMGIRVVMLTGDNQRTAQAVGNLAGVDEVVAGVLPGEKSNVINSLKSGGKVAMVGDGINDAPALTSADIGIAIGAGADVAVDAADVVLMKSSLSDAAAAIRLSRKTMTNIRQNLFWAFIYNIIGIPLAAGAFIWAGLTLNPMFGAAAMSLSSFCVVTNALRLNFVRLYPNNSGKADGGASKDNGGDSMTKTLKIKGMMCQHCEQRVNAALMAVDGVIKAEVSHKDGTAIVTLDSEVSEDLLINAVESEGYKVTKVI